MDNEFPDPDEEFDLIHQEEYELLREIEETQRKKENVQKLYENPDILRKESQQSLRVEPRTNNTKVNYNESSKEQPEENEFNETQTPRIESQASAQTNNLDNLQNESTKKRTYEELFGDISDLLGNDLFPKEYTEPREKRPRWDEPQEIIKVILEAKQKLHQYDLGVSFEESSIENKKTGCISTRVPSWNFVAVTRPYDSQRLYVKVQRNKFFNFNKEQSISNCLSISFDDLKTEAEEIMVKNAERASLITQGSTTENLIEDELWVDKYRPKSYIELLSDESVNRSFLHWIKLWDKIVFNRNIPYHKSAKLAKQEDKGPGKNKFMPEVDNKGNPVHKVVLLSGPPGLGKTTLAHIAAKHAGYNIVEVNASDERSPDAFKQVLLASTQMKAVMGSDPRPNCLILDEIDGAPAASIEILLKFVQGKLFPKGKKGKEKTDKDSFTCQRPVICICNEPYTPSLRSLRTIALVIPVPEVSVSKLADRLLEIARKENLQVSRDELLTLAKRSGCDVRSCLGSLQYMGNTNLKDNLSLGLKDSRKGIFDSWKDIFTIPMKKTVPLSIRERMQLIMKIAQNGETERLAQGVFYNYPEICSDKMQHVSISLEWFQFFDKVLSLVQSHQAWVMMPYTNYAFIIWHLYFAKAQNPKLSYPTAIYELNQQMTRSKGILATVQRTYGREAETICVDIIPFLPDLLSPRLRTVSGHLQSAKERADLNRLVNIILDFGLTLVQEKNIEGSYDYKFDPDIFIIGVFPGCKQNKVLSYAVKQIIAQELEVERLRRAAEAIGFNKEISAKSKNKTEETNTLNNQTKNINQENEILTENAPNHLKKLNDNPIKPKERVYKDFFGRVITTGQSKEKEINNKQGTSSTLNKHPNASRNDVKNHNVWYKYKEGFSNAVRRPVLMESLL